MYDFKNLLREVLSLILAPAFIMLTIFGNGIIFLSSLIFYHLERGTNPRVTTYLDALWWGFSTATTTGYGDITPLTDAGKILSILLMLAGLAIFAMYTALFAETILLNHKQKKHHHDNGR